MTTTTLLGNKAKLEIGDTTKTLVAKLTNIGAVEQTRAKVPVTALEDEHEQNAPGGVVSTGDISIEGFYVKGDEGQLAMSTSFASGKIDTFTVTYSDGAIWVLKGFITNLTVIGEATNDEGLPFAATIAVSEAPEFTPAPTT